MGIVVRHKWPEEEKRKILFDIKARNNRKKEVEVETNG